MIITAPELLPINSFYSRPKPYVFLGGTIDNGTGPDWQKRVTLNIVERFPEVTVFNPRRKCWNPNLEQTPENPEFLEQVNWELDAMNKADILLFYFASDSKSPITLMELGLWINKIHNKDIIVYCPKDFYRYGNVKIVCDRFLRDKNCFQSEYLFMDKIISCLVNRLLE